MRQYATILLELKCCMQECLLGKQRLALDIYELIVRHSICCPLALLSLSCLALLPPLIAVIVCGQLMPANLQPSTSLSSPLAYMTRTQHCAGHHQQVQEQKSRFHACCEWAPEWPVSR